jgi:hypothetical protein
MAQVPTSFNNTFGPWWKGAMDEQDRKDNGQFGSGGGGGGKAEGKKWESKEGHPEPENYGSGGRWDHEKTKVGETEHHTIHKYGGFGEHGKTDIHQIKSKKTGSHHTMGMGGLSFSSPEEAKHFSESVKDKPNSTTKEAKEIRKDFVSKNKKK